MVVGENAPPMHPFCRCSVAAVMADEEFEKLTCVNPVKLDTAVSDKAAVEKAKTESGSPIQTRDKEHQSGGKRYVPYDKDNKRDIAAAKAYKNISKRNDIRKVAENTGF